MSCYLGLLEERYRDRLDDQGRQFVAGAVHGADRMRSLIVDLLSLARLGTHGTKPEATPLNGVLGRALAALDASIRGSGARIVSDPLPTLDVDAGQIEQLFQNLIGNAIKFSGGRTPQIHVSARADGDEWTFAVRDNGIGIDPRHHERIFQIFQRLHDRQDYPGTGIGLAICRKVVERHGGKIRVESRPGEGATFLFTLPARRAG